MADNNPKLQAALNADDADFAADENFDLSKLAADKNLHKAAEIESTLAIEPANSPDLATASISPADTLRVSPPRQIRKTIQEATSVELTNSRSRSTTNQRDLGSKTGIFKNPFYRYDGGLLNKILALIGNILKVIERIFLRLLGARDTTLTPNRSQSNQTKSAETGAEDLEKRGKTPRSRCFAWWRTQFSRKKRK
jgi:hypothetical protein